MKPFRYTLQAVRTLREQQEQAALQNYSNSLRAAEAAEEKLSCVHQELEAAWAELQKLFAHHATAEHLARVQAYSQTVEKRKLECQRAVHVAHKKVREEFLKLVMARQAAAVLEKHFESQKRQHHRQRRRQDQKVLDDLAGRQNVIQVSQWNDPGTLRN